MVLFEDDFNAEASGGWIYNYDSFTNWNVTEGAVDLLSADHPGLEAFPTNGMFIDLDGTAPSQTAGTMESITVFAFSPGYTYDLHFDLAGSQRPGLGGAAENTVNVSLGSIYNQNITLDVWCSA